MAECCHGLDESWCAICLHGPKSDDPILVEATFVAKWPGHCRGCNLDIAPGQTICKLSDGQYVHLGCE